MTSSTLYVSSCRRTSGVSVVCCGSCFRAKDEQTRVRCAHKLSHFLAPVATIPTAPLIASGRRQVRRPLASCRTASFLGRPSSLFLFLFGTRVLRDLHARWRAFDILCHLWAAFLNARLECALSPMGPEQLDVHRLQIEARRAARRLPFRAQFNYDVAHPSCVFRRCRHDAPVVVEETHLFDVDFAPQQAFIRQARIDCPPSLCIQRSSCACKKARTSGSRSSKKTFLRSRSSAKEDGSQGMRTSIKRISIKSHGVIIMLMLENARKVLHVGGPKDAIYLCELLERPLFNGASTYFSEKLPRAQSAPQKSNVVYCGRATLAGFSLRLGSRWGGLPLLRLAPMDRLRSAPARAPA